MTGRLGRPVDFFQARRAGHNQEGEPMSKPGRRDQNLHADATQRDVKFFRAREEERMAAEEKTARLRGLRLAKEAVDRERAAAEAAAKAAAPPRKRRRAAVAAPPE
jgi:hypothetical protein